MAQNTCNSVTGKPLTTSEINHNFLDLHKPLNQQQALAESDRCLYCYDAPCIQACPTSIDIPTFIHQIRSDDLLGSAQTILSQNIMGGTCARVCPTEVLCEEACVLNTANEKPVEIGLLQRHAVDHLVNNTNFQPFTRAHGTGKHIAIVGAGPAGLSCAHRLAMLGNDVTIYEAKTKAGGLNEYGLAAYKMTDNWAQKEIDFLLKIGGIEIKYQQKISNIKELQQTHEAVFIGIGLDNTYTLGLDDEYIYGVDDAVDFIEELRQTEDKSKLKIGNDVVVIGAGNTAIDAAVQAKRLGAANVTLVYRRGESQMSATDYEIDLARTNGVVIKLWSAPIKIKGKKKVKAIKFAQTQLCDGKLSLTDKHYQLRADRVLKAIGQKLGDSVFSEFEIQQGKLSVDQNYQTSEKGIYAGGDAIASGEDLTVQAVEDGKQAAIAIDKALRGEQS